MSTFNYRPQDGGDGYVVYHDGDRIGWVRKVGQYWAATDAEMKAAGYFGARNGAAKSLLRRYRKVFGPAERAPHGEDGGSDGA